MNRRARKKQKLQHTRAFVARLLALPEELLRQLASWSPPSMAVLGTACRGLKQLVPWAVEAQEARFATIRKVVADAIEEIALRGGYTKFNLHGSSYHQYYEHGIDYDLKGCLNLDAGKRYKFSTEDIVTLLEFYFYHSLKTGKTKIRLGLRCDGVVGECQKCDNSNLATCLFLTGEIFCVKERAEIDSKLERLISVPMLNLLGEAYLKNADNFDLTWMTLLDKGVNGTAKPHWVYKDDERFCEDCEDL